MKILRGLLFEKNANTISIGRLSFWITLLSILTMAWFEKPIQEPLVGILYALLMYNTATKGVGVLELRHLMKSSPEVKEDG